MRANPDRGHIERLDPVERKLFIERGGIGVDSVAEPTPTSQQVSRRHTMSDGVSGDVAISGIVWIEIAGPLVGDRHISEHVPVQYWTSDRPYKHGDDRQRGEGERRRCRKPL